MNVQSNTTNKRKMKPVLNGDFWMIGDNPDLEPILGKKEFENGWIPECVDHHIFQAEDGLWHLWGCIRGTQVGRILYHWRSANLTDAHWEQTGEVIRSDQSYGEDLRRVGKQEWIQSPYCIKHEGKYYMYFGGHSSEWDIWGRASGEEDDWLKTVNYLRGQICLLLSDDGLHWERYVNENGQSRVSMGPGESRDPMLLKVGEKWIMYTAGAVVARDGQALPQIYARTSTDLLHWSDWVAVHYDFAPMLPERIPTRIWTLECPFVCEHEGYYYLFRTEEYPTARTHVYRSEDPMDFGLGDEEATEKYVGMIAVAAPEIVRDAQGDEFISSNHNLKGGTMLCRLDWIPDEEA